LKHATSERHAAQMLETSFVKQGSDCTGFNTIIASGRNATILHHSPTAKKISKNELLLIDAGAGFENYSGDISRTVPANGKFSKEQAEIYDVVLSALYAGIKQAKPKSTMDEIHKVAVVKIVEGLKKLKLLKGSTTQLIKSGAYQKFYMHRTGHFLGLDVHDINPVYEKNGKVISAYSRPLAPGNVITVEPGIYIDANEKSVPKRYRGIGIRIEEDVLITKTGNQVLSKDIPVERDEIEKLI
jgi:Xaa-Pro aminopeptidase